MFHEFVIYVKIYLFLLEDVTQEIFVINNVLTQFPANVIITLFISLKTFTLIFRPVELISSIWNKSYEGTFRT